MLLYITWDVAPDIFTIFGKEIRWYSLLWAVGILAAGYIVQKIYASEKLPEKWFDSLFWHVVVGVIIGARVGHCLFYDPIGYLSHPVEILKVWNGGLSSHGGVIGIILGVWWYSYKLTKEENKKYKVNREKTSKRMLWVFDRLVVGACITATCIRLGNLMNSEIFGYPTSLPWAFKFVQSKEYWSLVPEGNMGCHPTAIYEALTYFTMFIVSMYLYWKTDAKNKQGLIMGINMIVIFLSRFLIEFLKNVQEDFEIQMRATIGIDMGQMLSIPLVIWGIWLVWNALRKKDSVALNTK